MTAGRIVEREDKELVERLTDCIQFSVYAEAEEKDVQEVIELLAERDSFSGSDGWIIVKEDHYEQQAATITSLTAEVGTVKACLSSMRPRSDDAAYVAGFKAAVDEVRASLFEPIEALAAIQPTDTE
jgi:hypothetical protein